jgi:hypothetical protein
MTSVDGDIKGLVCTLSLENPMVPSRRSARINAVRRHNARPNIQIYDAHVVDLYQWVCARYLVGVKGAETKAKRS